MRPSAFAIILFVFTSLSWADCRPGTTLFYGNGMFNSKKDAEKSLKALIEMVPEDPSFRANRSLVAYNEDIGAVSQLLEAHQQKGFAHTRDFWKWTIDLGMSPEWFRNKLQKILVDADTRLDLESISLGPQLTHYRDELERSRNVVVVAHSQGNFFANVARLRLEFEDDSNARLFHIVSVANDMSDFMCPVRGEEFCGCQSEGRDLIVELDG